MKYVKNHYSRLTIHKQIQFGVMGVSLCVCFLVIFALSLNIFLLFNSYYNDAINFFEKKDNENIQLEQLNIDLTLTLITEKNRIALLNIRNFIQNNKRNKDFINKFPSKIFDNHLKKVSKNVDVSDFSYIYFKSFNPLINLDNNYEFLSLLKTMAITKNLFKSSFKIRYFNFPFLPIFSNFQLFSKEYDTAFYYSEEKKFNLSYTIKDFYYTQRYYASLASALYNEVTLKQNSNLDKNYMTLNWTITKNPLIGTVNPTIPLLFEHKYTTNVSLVSTFNPLYKENILSGPLNQTMANYTNLIDTLVADIPPNLIDTYAFISVKAFKYVSQIFANFKWQISSPSTCRYLIKYWQVFYDDRSSNNTFDKNIQFPNDCFYPPANITFNNTFNAIEINSQMKRKLRFVLGNFFGTSKKLLFKVFELNSPDAFTKFILDSPLLYKKMYIYTFKVQQYLTKINSTVYYAYTGNVLFILIFNLAIWAIVMAVIILMLYRFSSNISHPIQKLVEQVSSIGRQEKSIQTQSENKLTEIKFEYDKDINDLFLMCKALIKGGFTDDKESSNNKRIIRYKAVGNAYNNISLIKTNNLIIKEDKIKKFVSSTETKVFEFKQNSDNTNSSSEKINLLQESDEEDDLYKMFLSRDAIDLSNSDIRKKRNNKTKDENSFVTIKNIIFEEEVWIPKSYLNSLYLEEVKKWGDLEIVNLS